MCMCNYFYGPGERLVWPRNSNMFDGVHKECSLATQVSDSGMRLVRMSPDRSAAVLLNSSSQPERSRPAGVMSF